MGVLRGVIEFLRFLFTISGFLGNSWGDAPIPMGVVASNHWHHLH